MMLAQTDNKGKVESKAMSITNEHFSPKSTGKLNKFEDWCDIVNNVYFPLSINRNNHLTSDFNGEIKSQTFGHLSISQLESSPLSYSRRKKHIQMENEDYFLVTAPEFSSITFSQNGKDVTCKPGDLLIEGSSDPYLFRYESYNRMQVVKIPGTLLRDRVQAAQTYCATVVSGKYAAGALFMDFLKASIKQSQHLSSEISFKISEQLIDLLAITLELPEHQTVSCESVVKQAHMQRVQHYIRLNLRDSELSPPKIAAACGISTRYLHHLFGETEWSVSRWIRESRIKECYKILSDRNKSVNTMTELAYRYGFNDQATFNRCFKAKYNMTPKGVRARAFINTP